MSRRASVGKYLCSRFDAIKLIWSAAMSCDAMRCCECFIAVNIINKGFELGRLGTRVEKLMGSMGRWAVCGPRDAELNQSINVGPLLPVGQHTSRWKRT